MHIFFFLIGLVYNYGKVFVDCIEQGCYTQFNCGTHQHYGCPQLAGCICKTTDLFRYIGVLRRTRVQSSGLPYVQSPVMCCLQGLGVHYAQCAITPPLQKLSHMSTDPAPVPLRASGFTTHLFGSSTCLCRLLCLALQEDCSLSDSIDLSLL